MKQNIRKAKQTAAFAIAPMFVLSLLLLSMSSYQSTQSRINVADLNNGIDLGFDVKTYYSGETTTSSQDLQTLAAQYPGSNVWISDVDGRLHGEVDLSIETRIDGNAHVLSDNTTSDVATEKIEEIEQLQTGFQSWLDIAFRMHKFTSNYTKEAVDNTATATTNDVIYFASVGSEKVTFKEITVAYGSADSGGWIGSSANTTVDLKDTTVPKFGYYWYPLPPSGGNGEVTGVNVTVGDAIPTSKIYKLESPLFDHRNVVTDSVFNDVNQSSRVQQKPNTKQSSKWVGTESLYKHAEQRIQRRLWEKYGSDVALDAWNVSKVTTFEYDIGDSVSETLITSNTIGGIATFEVGRDERIVPYEQVLSYESVGITRSPTPQDVYNRLGDQDSMAGEVTDHNGEWATLTVNDGWERGSDTARGVMEHEDASKYESGIDALAGATQSRIDLRSAEVKSISDSDTTAGETLAATYAGANQKNVNMSAMMVQGKTKTIETSGLQVQANYVIAVFSDVAVGAFTAGEPEEEEERPWLLYAIFGTLLIIIVILIARRRRR